MPSHRGFMNIFSFLVAFTQMASNISYFPIAFLTDGYIYLFSFPITFPYGYISFGYIYFFSFPITFPYGYISFGYIYFFSFPITLPYGYIYILDAYISFLFQLPFLMVIYLLDRRRVWQNLCFLLRFHCSASPPISHL